MCSFPCSEGLVKCLFKALKASARGFICNFKSLSQVLTISHKVDDITPFYIWKLLRLNFTVTKWQSWNSNQMYLNSKLVFVLCLAWFRLWFFFLSSSAPQLKYAISYITWKWKWFTPGYGKDLARGLGSINKNWKKLSVAKMERKNK